VLLMCVCSISFPACTAHSPRCHLYLVTCTIFCILSHKWQDFRKEFTEPKTRVLIFCTHLCETFLITVRTERDMIINVYRSACKLQFARQFIEQYSDKLPRKAVTCSMRKSRKMDGQTGMKKLMFAFRNFANALQIFHPFTVFLSAQYI
jgi:hypothetical protein